MKDKPSSCNLNAESTSQGESGYLTSRDEASLFLLNCALIKLPLIKSSSATGLKFTIIFEVGMIITNFMEEVMDIEESNNWINCPASEWEACLHVFALFPRRLWVRNVSRNITRVESCLWSEGSTKVPSTTLCSS